jgi:hypothetical protein
MTKHINLTSVVGDPSVDITGEAHHASHEVVTVEMLVKNKSSIIQTAEDISRHIAVYVSIFDRSSVSAADDRDAVEH